VFIDVSTTAAGHFLLGQAKTLTVLYKAWVAIGLIGAPRVDVIMPRRLPRN
jgi:hypothetical protein